MRVQVMLSDELHAFVRCEGCGGEYRVGRDALPSFLNSPLVRTYARSFATAAHRNSLVFTVPGYYLAPCCEPIARDAMRKRDESLRARKERYGKRK